MTQYIINTLVFLFFLCSHSGSHAGHVQGSHDNLKTQKTKSECICLCFFTGPRVLSRLFLNGHDTGGGHAGHVQGGHGQPAAHARQVPLRLQPARLLTRHPWRLSHPQGPGRQQEGLHEVCCF